MAYGSGAALRSARGGLPFMAAGLGAKLLGKGMAAVSKAKGAVSAMPGGALMKGMAAGSAVGLGAKTAGTAVARRAAIPLPGGRTMRPLAALPGGAPFLEGRKKYRRINPGNVKALRRAMRRQDAFVKLAQSALKGSGYSVSRQKKLVSPKRCGCSGRK